MNGLGVTDAALLNRRVIAVKIDNHPKARPQSSLNQADAIYELLVEGGLTRFIVLFQSSDTSYIGPIRSGRPTDPTLLKPLGGPLQISGAQSWVQGKFNQAGVKLLGEGVTTFRISSRSAPHNLYGDTTKMRVEADRRSLPNEPPPPMFNFSDAPTTPVGSASEITLDWSDFPEVRWEWDGARYVRFNGTLEANEVSESGEETQIAADTLVVLFATRYTASPRGGQSGSSVPALDTVGTNRAVVFYDGGVVEGTWVRDSIDEPFHLVDSNGDPIELPRGIPWISVFPDNRILTYE
ncbi:MAG: DUF3048 domain-containing protein [Actinobacteria bacterium]|nr:DUF3048 domain-containing protein [Actinomycetota bacterium]